MTNDHRRYFIELQPKDGTPVPRRQEIEHRREQAARFIANLGDWLRREALENKVASMAITAMGQVQIICDSDIIHHLRHEDETPIATIRNSSMYMDSMNRWGDAR
jgi:hypothetical protein